MKTRMRGATSLNSRLESLERTVTSQQEVITAQQALLSRIDTAGGVQSYNLAQEKFVSVFSNISDIYRHLRNNRESIRKKCSKKKCDRLVDNVTKLKTSVKFIQDTNITVLEQMVDLLKNTTTAGALVQLQTDLTAVKSCMTDPTTTDCTAVYGDSSSLPSSLAGKCEATTCSALTSDLTDIKNCFSSPSSPACTSVWGGASSLPSVLGGKCEQTSCDDLAPIKSCMEDTSASACTDVYGSSPSLAWQVSTLAGCMTDPTAATCTGTYGGSSNLPGLLAAKCEGTTCTSLTTGLKTIQDCFSDPTATDCTAKCDSGTCTSLQTDLTPLKSCLTDPTATDCTGTYGSATNLPSVLAGKCDGGVCSLLQTCLTTPADTGCTITAGTSVPALVTNLDKCMTSVEDSTCTASYGSSSNLISGGGSGMVGWIQQFRKPAIVQCAYTASSSLTFNDLGSGATTVTVAAGNIPANCDVGRQYQILPFDQCSQSAPDSSDKTHLKPEDSSPSEYIEIMSEGWYKIDFTALLQDASDGRIVRADVYKVSSKDPTDSCNAVTETCEVALQIRLISRLTDKSDPTQGTDITTHNEGAFHLCAGDKILVIISKSGSSTNSLADIFGVTDSRTILVITKIWFP